MWELEYKEIWVLKNWCFWTVMLEKTLESPLDCKEIQSVHPKGDKSWLFIGRTVVEAETPILWPPDAKNWLIWKDPDAGKDWRQEEKRTTDEIVGWHHRLDGHEFGWTSGVGDGQRGLASCSPWGRKESDTTEWLNWTTTLGYADLEILVPKEGLLPSEDTAKAPLNRKLWQLPGYHRLFIPLKQKAKKDVTTLVGVVNSDY